MTPRDRLRQLVETLPESHIPAAEGLLESLRLAPDPVAWALAHAPLDAEGEDSEGEQVAVEEARAEAERGEAIPQEELERRLGLR